MTNAKKKQKQEQDRKSRVKKKQEGQKLQMLPEEKTQKLPGEKMQKFPAEKPLETIDNKINRNIKDSVFCNLFGMPEYLMQLYQVLHPDDTETTEDDLTIVTLSRTVARNIYNDLGFLVRNRLLVLVEAQSTWSENILVRFLMYLGETYRRYIKTKGLRIYSEKNVDIPKPELYLVFTGKREDKIRICKNKNVLNDYLAREEAAAIMFTIADQAEAMKEALEMERAEGKAEGKAEGLAEGEGRMAALMKKLLSLGRMEDLQKAATDQKYREVLYTEFKIS